ncbi:MAG: glycosyltransferase family 9 protein [Clostridiales bacterium]
MNEPKNILIVRTDRIGDVVLTLPLAALIKKRFPEASVSFLVREYTKPCVTNNPYIDNVLVLKEKNGRIMLRENIRLLKKYKFDSCVVVFPLFQIALIMLLSGIKKRIGTGYRWYSFLFNNKIFQHRKYAESHELEYNVNLLDFLGVNEKVNKKNVEFGLRPTPENEQKIEQLLLQNKIDRHRPIIIIHPGSGGSAVDLPVESFKRLTSLLAHYLPLQIIVSGSDAEKSVCNELIMDNSVKNFAGKLNLGEFIALINKADLLIANSTGPIHLAAALKKSVVGFYPKITACSAERWGPYTEKSSVFLPTLDCKNCSREQCERLKCMDSIDMKEVFNNIKEIIKSQYNGEIDD